MLSLIVKEVDIYLELCLNTFITRYYSCEMNRITKTNMNILDIFINIFLHRVLKDSILSLSAISVQMCPTHFAPHPTIKGFQWI